MIKLSDGTHWLLITCVNVNCWFLDCFSKVVLLSYNTPKIGFSWLRFQILDNKDMGKICTKCKKYKEFGEFNKLSESKDGHQPVCKQCIKEYREKPENKIRDKIARRERYLINKEHTLLKRSWRHSFTCFC